MVEKSHDELFQVVRGGPETATWAHWQIGLAYAKYLSPAFHAWCNEVVRGHMEGDLRPAAAQGLTATDRIAAWDVAHRRAVDATSNLRLQRRPAADEPATRE